MIEKLVTQVLQKYLYQYLKNFDQRNLNISLLRGKIDLKDLQLNESILKNVPLPVKLKYGRIGSIHIELPSLMSLANPQIKVSVSDIFVCLTVKPTEEWDAAHIVEEYHEDRRQIFAQQEEDAKYMFEEYRGDEEKMNNYFLKLIQNIHVEVNRIYLRLEDPRAPLAIGLILPAIRLASTDMDWNVIDLVKGDAAIMHKIIQANQFQVFLDHGDSCQASLDVIMGLDAIQGAVDYDRLLQLRIQRHIDHVFSDDFKAMFILQKFYIDIRFRLVLDKKRVLEKYPGWKQPDLSLNFLLGDLYENYDNEETKNWLSLKISESQLVSLCRFFSFVGLYNTFRVGVLQKVLDRNLDLHSPEVEDYIQLHERYLQSKLVNDSEGMGDARRGMFKIEKRYRIDLVFMLRKLVQEKFYGIQRAQEYKTERLRELAIQKISRQSNNSFLSRIPLFGKKESDSVLSKDMETLEADLRTDPELRLELRKINLAFVIFKAMYVHRYDSGMKDLEQYSQLRHDVFFAFIDNRSTFVMALDVKLPKLQLEIFDSEKPDRSKPSIDLVIEGLEVSYLSESKPPHSCINVTLENIYILDHHSLTPALPYFIQTVMPYRFNPAKDRKAMEIVYQSNPKNSMIATHSLKFHNMGQLYIYANLDFCQTLIVLATKLMHDMHESHRSMILAAELNIQYAINKGSFYQEMLGKAVEEKQDQLYEALEKITRGEYEAPSLDLDIQLISPKIIIYEKLLCHNHCMEQKPIAMVLDLGTIYVSSELIRKNRNIDYEESTDPSILYNKIIVKFGGLKVTVDYDLRFLQNSNDEAPSQPFKLLLQKKNYKSEIKNTGQSLEQGGLESEYATEYNHRIPPHRVSNEAQIVISDMGQSPSQREEMEDETLQEDWPSTPRRVQQKWKQRLNMQRYTSSQTFQQSTQKPSQVHGSKEVNWRLSEKFHTVVMQEVNFGFEIKASLVPFHKFYPSQVINIKFNEIKLNLSRKVIQSIFIVENVFFDSQFWGKLQLFMNLPPSSPVDIRDEEGNLISSDDLKFELMNEQEKEKELQRRLIKEKVMLRHHDSDKERTKKSGGLREGISLLQSVKRLVFDQTIEDVKQKYKSDIHDEAKKSVTIQVNVVFAELTVTYQELEVFFQDSSTVYAGSLAQPGLYIQDIFELQISNIHGQLHFIPKVKTDYIVVLEKLFITYKDPDQDTSVFKYLILNPKALNTRPSYGIADQRRESQIHNLYREEHRSTTKMDLSNYQIQVNFKEFAAFQPRYRVQSQSRQLEIRYEEVNDVGEMEIILGKIELVFIVPLIYSMFKAYADSMIDSYVYEKLVQEKMDVIQGKKKLPAGGIANVKSMLMSQRTKIQKQKSTVTELTNRTSANKKQFVLDAAYSTEEVKKNSDKQDKQTNSSAFAKSATRLMKFKRDPKKQTISPFKTSITQDIIEETEVVEERKRENRSYLRFKAETLEVSIPSNLHEEDSLSLRMSLVGDVNICKRSLFMDTHLKDSQRTWIDTVVLNDTSHMDMRITELQIYMTNQGKSSAEAQHDYASSFNQGPNLIDGRIHLLHPYDIQLIIDSYTEVVSEREAYSKTHMTYNSDKVLNLTVGLCELNSYLLLGQLFFSLLNEIMRLNKQISETEKQMQAQSSNKAEEEVNESDQKRSTVQIDNRRLELEDILRNENLIQSKSGVTINKWKRAGKLAAASVSRRDFYEVINDFNLHKGVCMQFVDNVSMQNLALLSLHLGLKKFHLESRGFDVESIYKMEHLFQIERIREVKELSFFRLLSELTLKGTYFNRSNYFEEPFIEEYPFTFQIKQQTPMSKAKQLMHSSKMLNINLTFGMACNVQKIIKTILQMEAQLKHYFQENQMDQQDQMRSQNDSNILSLQGGVTNQYRTNRLEQMPQLIQYNYQQPATSLEYRNVHLDLEQCAENLAPLTLQHRDQTRSYQGGYSADQRKHQSNLLFNKISNNNFLFPVLQLNKRKRVHSTPIEKMQQYAQQKSQSQIINLKYQDFSALNRRVSRFEDIQEEDEHQHAHRQSTIIQPRQFDSYRVGEENVRDDSAEREKEGNFDSENELDVPDEKLNKTVDMPPERQVRIFNVHFHNHTGQRILFCLSMHTNLLKFRKHQKVDGDYQIAGLDFERNPDIKCLEPTQFQQNALVVNFKEFSAPLRQHKGVAEEDVLEMDQRVSVPINFKVHGFKRIRHVILQRNGVFGYFLIHQLRRKRDLMGSERSQVSCIVRIKRKEEDIHVHFESNLILQNETSINLSLQARATEDQTQIDQISIKSGHYHHSKVSWQIAKTSLWLLPSTRVAREPQMLIKKLNKTFDPQLIKPRKDSSLILQVGSKYLAMDVYFLKTNTNVGQFLVVFQPILTIHNLLFTEICLDYKSPESNKQQDNSVVTIMHLHTNQSKTLTKFDPYSRTDNQCVLRNRVSETEYFQARLNLNLNRVRKYSKTFFKRGIVVRLQAKDMQDQTRNVTAHAVLEQVKENAEFKVHKYENFNLRQIIYKKTKSVNFKLYAPYVAVNRTEEPIFLYDVIDDPNSHSRSDQVFLNPLSNILIAPINRKIRIKVEDYFESKPFLINTLGMSGTILQTRDPRVMNQKGPKSSLSSEELESRKTIEIGTYISSCPHPYARTKVIKFQPRYRVFNQINLVLVLMLEGTDHQIAVMPDEEVTLNLRSGQENYLRVRLIDINQETRKVQGDQEFELNQEEYNHGRLTEGFKNMTDRKISLENNFEYNSNAVKLLINKAVVSSTIKQSFRVPSINLGDEHARISSPLQVNMNGENDNLEDQVFNDDRRIVILDRSYATSRKDDFSVWSYKFPVKDLDDFQLSVPNKMNSMHRLVEHSKGWQESDDKFFVRVNISPSSENDATIYVSFSYPMYPDYVLFNDTGYMITVQHDSEQNGNSKNEVYELKPQQKDVIVLNPVQKDKDYLLIKFFRPHVLGLGYEVFHSFYYEIDSMEHSTKHDEYNSWHIYTKATMNLRFIHLLREDQYEQMKLKEEIELAQYEEEHCGSLSQLDDFKMHHNHNDALRLDQHQDHQAINQVDSTERQSPFKEDTVSHDNRRMNFYHNVSFGDSHHQPHKRGPEDSKTLDQKIEEEKEIAEGEGMSFLRAKKVEEFSEELVESSLVEMSIDIEGLGISMVDHQPRELCYISIYKPKLLQITKYSKNRQGVEHTHRQVHFKMINLQIDNMMPRSFPVILGPRQSFCFIERQYRETLKRRELERILVHKSKTPKVLLQNQIPPQLIVGPKKIEVVNADPLDSLDEVCFLQLQFDNESFTDKKLTTQKINHFRIALTEIAINFHSYFLNRMLQFISSLTNLIPDEQLSQFTQSQTMENYNRLFALVKDKETQLEVRQDGQNALVQSSDSSSEDDADLGFGGSFAADSNRRRADGVGVPTIEIVQAEDFGTQAQRQMTNFKSLKEREERRNSFFKSKRLNTLKFKRMDKVCAFISARPIKYSKGQGIVSSKILVKEISIKALKIYLTFRVSKIENSGAEGLGNGILNFFMNFANVSDAILYFTEIEIVDAYTSLEDVQTRLMKHYIKQGIEQLYQVLGATDIIGNPVSLVNNLGRGVEQLYSQPFKGALQSQGNALTTVVGIKDGIRDFAKITTGGISNSVAKMSGTWYMSLANLSGRQISESNLDDPNSFHSGVYQGSKGLVLELSKGVTGIVSMPMKRVREEGRGFRQVAKGTVQGVFGLLTAPFNGVLKFIHSTSTGTKNHVEGDSSRLTRHRYPRSFNEMQIMSEFESLRSHAYAALLTVEGGLYKNENIHLFADISERLKGPKSRFKERILICTDERILLVQGLNKVKAEIPLKQLAEINYQNYLYQGSSHKRQAKESESLEKSHKCGFQKQKIIVDSYSSRDDIRPPSLVLRPRIKPSDEQLRVAITDEQLMPIVYQPNPMNASLGQSQLRLLNQNPSQTQNLMVVRRFERRDPALVHSVVEMQQNRHPLHECNIILVSRKNKSQYIISHRINQCKRFVIKVAAKLRQFKQQQCYNDQSLRLSDRPLVQEPKPVVVVETKIIQDLRYFSINGGGGTGET